MSGSESAQSARNFSAQAKASLTPQSVKDAEMARRLQELRSNLKLLFRAHPNPVGLVGSEVKSKYEQMFKKKLVYSDYGFQRLAPLLRSLPNVKEIGRKGQPYFMLRCSPDQIGANQPVDFDLPTSGGFKANEKLPDSKISVDTKTKPALTTQPIKAPELARRRDDLAANLRLVFRAHPNHIGLLGHEVVSKYEQMFTKKLVYSDYGFGRLSSLLGSFPDIEKVSRHGQRYFKLRRSTEQIGTSQSADFDLSVFGRPIALKYFPLARVSADAKVMPDSLSLRVKQILQRYPVGLSKTEICVIYYQLFRKDLVAENDNFAKLSELLKTVPGVEMIIEPGMPDVEIFSLSEDCAWKTSADVDKSVPSSDDSSQSSFVDVSSKERSQWSPFSVEKNGDFANVPRSPGKPFSIPACDADRASQFLCEVKELLEFYPEGLTAEELIEKHGILFGDSLTSNQLGINLFSLPLLLSFGREFERAEVNGQSVFRLRKLATLDSNPSTSLTSNCEVSQRTISEANSESTTGDEATFSDDFKSDWSTDLESVREVSVLEALKRNSESIKKQERKKRKRVANWKNETKTAGDVSSPNRNLSPASDGKLSESLAKTEPDECSIFGAFVAEKLRYLDHQSRDSAMLEIQYLIMHIKYPDSDFGTVINGSGKPLFSAGSRPLSEFSSATFYSVDH